MSAKHTEQKCIIGSYAATKMKQRRCAYYSTCNMFDFGSEISVSNGIYFELRMKDLINESSSQLFDQLKKNQG